MQHHFIPLSVFKGKCGAVRNICFTGNYHSGGFEYVGRCFVCLDSPCGSIPTVQDESLQLCS